MGGPRPYVEIEVVLPVAQFLSHGWGSLCWICSCLT
jgi:hypothetical protein